MAFYCLCTFHINAHILLYIFILLSIFSCSKSNIDNEKIKKSKKDSILAIKKKEDSITINNISTTKEVMVGDKTIKIISKPKASKEVKFENEYLYSTTFNRKKIAERNNVIISFQFKLTSKSKSNTNNFFPNLNVFVIDKKTNNIKHINEMSYQLLNKTDKPISYLEQIFDYQESEIFVGWVEVEEKLLDKIVISVNKGGNRKFMKEDIVANFTK